MHRTSITQHTSRIAAYVADAGGVAFVAVAVVIAFTAVVEHYRPGTAASYLPPQGLLLLAVASGITSLAAKRDGRRPPVRRVAYALVGLVMTGIVMGIAWRYFAPLDDARLPLTAAAVFITGSAFVGMGKVAETGQEG